MPVRSWSAALPEVQPKPAVASEPRGALFRSCRDLLWTDSTSTLRGPTRRVPDRVSVTTASRVTIRLLGRKTRDAPLQASATSASATRPLTAACHGVGARPYALRCHCSEGFDRSYGTPREGEDRTGTDRATAASKPTIAESPTFGTSDPLGASVCGSADNECLPAGRPNRAFAPQQDHTAHQDEQQQ